MMKLDKKNLSELLTIIDYAEVAMICCARNNIISYSTVLEHSNQRKVLKRLRASKHTGFGRYVTTREIQSLLALIEIGNYTVRLAGEQNFVSEIFVHRFIDLAGGYAYELLSMK